MPFIQIKISDNVAALLEEAKATGSGFEFKSNLHGLDIQITPGIKPTLTGSFSNFKVVAEPQIVVEERQAPAVEPVLPQKPSNVVSIKLPHSKEEVMENRRNLLVGLIRRNNRPMVQAEVRELLLKDCGVDCSVSTVREDLNELKRLGIITSYTERGNGTVYKVIEPPTGALGF